MEPVFLFRRYTSTRSSDTADLQDFGMLPRLNRQQLLPRRHLAVNSFTRRFQLWRHTCFIYARIMLSSMAINQLEQTWRSFDEEELVDLVLSVAPRTLGKPRLIEIFESAAKLRTTDSC
jgi:hypothetical protein